MSFTVCVLPIIKALITACSFLNFDPGSWNPINHQQTFFLQEYYSKRNELSFFNDKELRAWASTNYQELNTILKNEGFSIQLKPFDGVGVVSILDVMVEWLTKGERTTLYSEFKDEEKKFPAVQMKEDFDVYLAAVHNHPIAAIKTKTGDIVYMTIANEKLEDFALQKYIGEIHNSMYKQNGYEYVLFPMVDLNREENIKWLLGMQLPDKWQITQALQQTKFKMNELGARVKSAVAIVLEKSMRISKNVSIDQPFYLWIKRPNVSVPVFAAYITQDDWKDPLNLEL